MDLRMLIPIMGILLVMIPVAGLTLILTTRLALKPLVEMLAKALSETGYGQPVEANVRIEELEEQVSALTAEIRQVQEAQDFDQKLLE